MTNRVTAVDAISVKDLLVARELINVTSEVAKLLEDEAIFINSIIALVDVPVSFIKNGVLVIDEESLITSIRLHHDAGYDFDSKVYATWIVKSVTSDVVDGSKFDGEMDAKEMIPIALIDQYRDVIDGLHRAAQDLNGLGTKVEKLINVGEGDKYQVSVEDNCLYFTGELISEILEKAKQGKRDTRIADALVTLALR